MTTTQRRGDRRTLRTRQALQQAFIDVVREKGFAATSILDITERANVNRGTFYLHFTDKYMLLDGYLREHFRHLLASNLPPTAQWNRSTLLELIETLLHYFECKYRHQPRLPRIVAPLVEQAIHEELTGLIESWLKQSEGIGSARSVPAEAIANVVSWTLFGAVLQWSQEESPITAEHITQAILLVILDGVTQVAPLALPE